MMIGDVDIKMTKSLLKQQIRKNKRLPQLNTVVEGCPDEIELGGDSSEEEVHDMS